jgi:hypothetical protein
MQPACQAYLIEKKRPARLSPAAIHHQRWI